MCWLKCYSNRLQHPSMIYEPNIFQESNTHCQIEDGTELCYSFRHLFNIILLFSVVHINLFDVYACDCLSVATLHNSYLCWINVAMLCTVGMELIFSNITNWDQICFFSFFQWGLIRSSMHMSDLLSCGKVQNSTLLHIASDAINALKSNIAWY